LSNEIAQNFTSGETLYACRFQLNGHVFLTDGASDEEWGTGGRDADDYDVTLTESGDSGHYVGDFDGLGNIAAGIYRVAVYLQIGANPANSDPAISQGTVYWDGSACVSVLDIFDKLPTNYIMGSSDQSDKDDEIDAIKERTDNLPDDPADQSEVEAAITASEAAIIAEIDENEDKIDAISADTGKVVYGSVASGKVISGSVTGFVEDEKE